MVIIFAAARIGFLQGFQAKFNSKCIHYIQDPDDRLLLLRHVLVLQRNLLFHVQSRTSSRSSRITLFSLSVYNSRSIFDQKNIIMSIPVDTIHTVNIYVFEAAFYCCSLLWFLGHPMDIMASQKLCTISDVRRISEVRSTISRSLPSSATAASTRSSTPPSTQSSSKTDAPASPSHRAFPRIGHQNNHLQSINAAAFFRHGRAHWITSSFRISCEMSSQAL